MIRTNAAAASSPDGRQSSRERGKLLYGLRILPAPPSHALVYAYVLDIVGAMGVVTVAVVLLLLIDHKITNEAL